MNNNTEVKQDAISLHTKGEWKLITDTCGNKVIASKDGTTTIMQLSGWTWQTKNGQPYFDATNTTGVSDQEAQANAARIVKCVNAHDELVKALQRCVDWFYLNAKDKKIPMEGIGAPAFLSEAKEALTKANQ